MVASGNNGVDACSTSPARVGQAITVNALKDATTPASFSDFGSCTDLWAPGVGILSATNRPTPPRASRTERPWRLRTRRASRRCTCNGIPGAPPRCDNALRFQSIPNAVQTPSFVKVRLFSRFTFWQPEGDYNDDQRTDLTVWRPSTGQWFVNGLPTQSWGVSGDKPVPGDYNGDGVTERAVWRPSTGQWFVPGSNPVTWGVSSDIPVPGDYNADGRTDMAVWRPATRQWFVLGENPVTYGEAGDIPVPADYDGDGRTDRATFRPSTGRWDAQFIITAFLGGASDIPVPGDYDGDGLADIAVWRRRRGSGWSGTPAASRSPSARAATSPCPRTTTATGSPTRPSGGRPPDSGSYATSAPSIGARTATSRWRRRGSVPLSPFNGGAIDAPKTA